MFLTGLIRFLRNDGPDRICSSKFFSPIDCREMWVYFDHTFSFTWLTTERRIQVAGGQVRYLLILTEEFEVDLDTSRGCVCVCVFVCVYF